MFPKAAILEPVFLQTLSKDLLSSTVFDAFSHAFEGFLSINANPFSDTIAIESINMILTTINNTNNFNNITYENLKKFLYASSLAGIVILHTKTTFLHALGYYLTNYKNIHHGKTNAILFPYYLKLCQNAKIDKLKVIEDLFNKNNISLNNFSEIFCGSMDISKIIPLSEANDFINYAINKSNTKTCLFKVEFDKVKQVLYP
jgi:alcohol dehydrogenase class IV